MSKAQYIMIGGFLGAGKTTAILQLAEHLTSNGLRVGLITNDQSVGLVDTAMANSHGYPVEEITGGCFCCRFNSLIEASERLTEESRPDVFIAEPVGSCTDLRAAVSYPLRRLYGDQFQIAPLSVLVDPIRALRILGLEPGKAFSPKVLYVYGKQLEEAEVIVINKVDAISAEQLHRLEDALRVAYPRAQVFSASAREGTGLEPWFGHIAAADPGDDIAPVVDYELYAEGEALLGWFNSTIQISAKSSFDGNAFLLNFARLLQDKLNVEALEVAHLKMVLAPDDGDDIAVVNLVRSDGNAESSYSLQEPLDAGELIINLRAEGDPDTLRQAATDALAQSAKEIEGFAMVVGHSEFFRPAKPTPTYRMATVQEGRE